jgi:hypothetical protein
MTRVIGSLEMIASADAPAWMIRMLVKTLEDVHNRKDVIARLWETVPSSPLACECLGALYRTRAIHKAARAAQAPDTRAHSLWEVQSESNASGRWRHMYFPLAHWIYSRCVESFSPSGIILMAEVPRSSRPCPVFDSPLGHNGCELCIGVKDPAYLQMLSDAAAIDMSSSEPSGADVHADSEARFTFRPALLILENTFRWTQMTTDLILADIMASIEARTSDMEATAVEDALVSYGQAH